MLGEPFRQGSGNVLGTGGERWLTGFSLASPGRGIEHWLRCILGEEQPETSGEVGRAGIAIAEAAYRSAQTGQLVLVAGLSASAAGPAMLPRVLLRLLPHDPLARAVLESHRPLEVRRLIEPKVIPLEPGAQRAPDIVHPLHGGAEFPVPGLVQRHHSRKGLLLAQVMLPLGDSPESASAVGGPAPRAGSE